MKQFIIMFACLVLGALTSCVKDETISSDVFIPQGGEENYVTSGCEPATETHYKSWFINSKGEKVSTLIPYVYTSSNHSDYEVLDSGLSTSYWNMRDDKRMTTEYDEGDISIAEWEHCITIKFTNCSVLYYLVEEIPSSGDNQFPVLRPSFKLHDYFFEELPDEEGDGKAYYCSHLTLVLKVTQGDNETFITKQVKLKEEKVPIYFDVDVEDWGN